MMALRVSGACRDKNGDYSCACVFECELFNYDELTRGCRGVIRGSRGSSGQNVTEV